MMEKEINEKITLQTLGIDVRDLGVRMTRLEEGQAKTGVLLERLEGKFSLLYEGYLAHDARFVSMEDRMDKIEVRMDGLELRMDHLEAKMDKLELRMNKLETKMDKLEAKMNDLEARMEVLEAKMDTGFDLVLEKLNVLAVRVGVPI